MRKFHAYMSEMPGDLKRHTIVALDDIGLPGHQTHTLQSYGCVYCRIGG